MAAPSAGEDQLLDELMGSLTPRERVGQLVLINFVGADASERSAIGILVRDYKVGAVLLSASNGNVINRGDTAAQVAALTNGLQQRAYEGTARSIQGRDVFLPLLVAADNEGDLFPYTNISHNFTPIPSPMTVGATWSKADAEAVGRIAGQELSLVGVNLLLGPVVDVLENPRSGGPGDIGTRAFGGNPPWVGVLGRAYVRGVHQGSKERMLTVGKHFPGHGGSDRLPDNEVATINRSLEDLRGGALAPFAALAAADSQDAPGATDGLMTSHIRHGGLQPLFPSTRPLSLDPEGLNKATALPEFATWRRTGLLLSDSLGVLAIKRWYDPTLQSFPNRQVARDALLAGNDLLALVEFSQERGWGEYQVPSIVDTLNFMEQQYAADPLLRARVDDALRRVLASKLKLYPPLTLDAVLVSPQAASEGVGREQAAMAALARDALSLISPRPGELAFRMPRGPQAGEKVLFVECWSDCYPFRVLPQRELADAVLRRYGPEATGKMAPEDLSTVSFGELTGWLDRTLEPEADKRVSDAVFRADWIVFALADYNPAGFPASGAAKRFLSSAPLDFRNKKLVAIAFNAPYHLDATELGKLTACFAVYSKTPEAVDAAVQGLFREIEPKGTSPVSIVATGYDVNAAVQPDPEQALELVVEGQGDGVTARTRPVRDRLGRPIPDGTVVSFVLSSGREEVARGESRAVDGVASWSARAEPGSYSLQARTGGLSSKAASVTLRGRPIAQGGQPPAPEDRASSPGPGLLAAGASLLLVAAAGVAALAVWRRRETPTAPLPSWEAHGPPEPLSLDPKTHQVWVEGKELDPPLSAEQYRLLAWLYTNRGQVCSREAVIAQVWPGANLAGVSEEALDALVRRVRDRLAHTGATRRYIVTLRGQGFRLDC